LRFLRENEMSFWLEIILAEAQLSCKMVLNFNIINCDGNSPTKAVVTDKTNSL